MTKDEWETVRRRWARLERMPLSPDEVFDAPAQRRIGRSIAREALSEPQRVVRLKLARRSEGYYLLQAAEAQDRAERAQSPKDREAWQDVAAKWHGLLKRMKHSSEV